jgi:hypothetical protein
MTSIHKYFSYIHDKNYTTVSLHYDHQNIFICIKVSSRLLKLVNIWNRSPFWNALSREFRCRWRNLSCKLRPEIDNGFTFTLIKTTMSFNQIRKYIELLNFKTKTMQFPLPNWVVNIGQDAQWNVNKHRIYMQIIHYGWCFSGNIWLWLLSQNGSSKMAPFWHQNL